MNITLQSLLIDCSAELRQIRYLAHVRKLGQLLLAPVIIEILWGSLLVSTFLASFLVAD